MRSVAILTTRSPEGVVGGAERLYEGLVEAFRLEGWYAEEIPITFDESSFKSILDGYQSAKKLNVLSYDLVISTKSPTYAVLHPNHSMWLVHTIRVFYDKFEETIKHQKGALAARDKIVDLDNRIFCRPNLRRFSIGETVSTRLKQHNGLDARCVYPPHPRSELFFPPDYASDRRHIFTASRLHEWKRVGLIVEAFRKMPLNVPLLIAGEGPEINALKTMSNGDPRIKFLGYVDDEELAVLYRTAIAVPFVPTSEDYGYVAIEAMLSGTPVITTHDSGEPAIMVQSSGAGIVTSHTPEALARAIEEICGDQDRAQVMGRAGRSWASKLSWSNVVRELSNDQI